MTIRSFPGAEGFGAFTTGGRGGKVLHVTSEADSGVGTLRWALEQSGPRMIVFEVNEVRLTRDLQFRNDHVTIAGESAGGVQVSGASVRIAADNVIVRGMAFRPGDARNNSDPSTRDGLQVGTTNDTVTNVIIDRNSFTWATDENVSIFGRVSNLTFSNNIVAQGLDESIHPKGAHSMGLLVYESAPRNDPSRLTISDNLFAFNGARNPRVVNGDQIEYVNNYHFAYTQPEQNRFGAQSTIRSDFSAHVINNVFEAGSSTQNDSQPGFAIDYNARGKVFVSGNQTLTKSDQIVSQQSQGSAPSPDRLFSGSGVSVDSTSSVKANALANAGVLPSDRNAIDQRIVDLVKSGAGGLVDSVAEAGGWRSRPDLRPAADTDRDGMPDWYESQRGTNLRVFDANGDANRNGYTNLEDYLHSLMPRGGATRSLAADAPVASLTPAPDARVVSTTPDAGRTGTGLDRILEVIATDSVLSWSITAADRSEGSAAAAALNNLILDGVEARGLFGDGRISDADVWSLSNWIRSNADRFEYFDNLRGSRGGDESGWHVVLDDGNRTTLFGLNAVNTVFESLYSIGYAPQDNRLVDEFGAAQATVSTAAQWLTTLLAEDYAG